MGSMTRLTSVQGTFEASVLAARLESEGFDVQLRGALQSAYPVTVGDLGRVDVYVPDDQVEEASYVLLVGEIDETLDLPEPAPPRRPTPWAWRVAAGAVLVGIGLSVLRALDG